MVDSNALHTQCCVLVQAADAAQKESDNEKGWNLEDETGFDDEDEQAGAPSKSAEEPKQDDAMELVEGGDEIDPLDAFMAENEAQVEPVKTEDNGPAAKGGHLLL